MRLLVKLLTLVATLLFALGGQCQQSPSKPEGDGVLPAPADQDWRDAWRHATVSFGEIARDSLTGQEVFHVLGTGVIVSAALHTGYIVTARHMFWNQDTKFHPYELRVRFAWQEKKSFYTYFGVRFALRGKDGADLWSSLDDDSDVAAIPMFDTDAVLPAEDRLKSYNSIPFSQFAEDPFEGESILVIGYPGIVGNDKLVRAIVRQGIVAWTNPQQAERPFLVDANLYPGNSGGPVVQLPFGIQRNGSFNYAVPGEMKLLGIVSQVPQQDLRTMTPIPRLGQIESHTQIVGVGSIGVIEPVSKIRELITAMQQHQTKAPVCDVPEPKATAKQ